MSNSGQRFGVGCGVVSGIAAQTAFFKSLGGTFQSGSPLTPNEIGRIGEESANIIKNTRRITSLTGTADYRIPDVLDKANKIIGEVKNVKGLSYTNQLRDYLLHAQKYNLRFDLYIRSSTKLSGPLNQLIQKGAINAIYLP